MHRLAEPGAGAVVAASVQDTYLARVGISATVLSYYQFLDLTLYVLYTVGSSY